MAYNYQSWSVVFGEQPSASKWNILGTNDASFDERIGTDFSSGTDSPIWWEELGRTTLGSAGDTISVTPIGARKYLRVFVTGLPSGSIRILLRFNNDSGNNYAYRTSTNGGADATGTSASSISTIGTGAVFMTFVADIINISAQEKYVVGMYTNSTAAAGNAPSRIEMTGKWANTSSQITRIDAVNDQAGSFEVGSQVVVLGHD